MKLKVGKYKTVDGTEVTVDVKIEWPDVWVGHSERLPKGNAAGVMVWLEDGSVAIAYASEDQKKNLRIVSERL